MPPSFLSSYHKLDPQEDLTCHLPRACLMLALEGFSIFIGVLSITRMFFTTNEDNAKTIKDLLVITLCDEQA
ncbi:hypothetical protein Tco_1386254 [Tanacetum coccineum]